MFILEIIRLGLWNLRLHLLRSALTALGIILGVAAVITMVSIGEGSKRQALDQIERLGARDRDPAVAFEMLSRAQRPALERWRVQTPGDVEALRASMFDQSI